MDPDRFAALVSELVNNLQAAVLLSARLAVDTKQSAKDAADLRAAVDRAAQAARLGRTPEPPADR
jgi:hypothetical protein